jgi:hypothetical protein
MRWSLGSSGVVRHLKATLLCGYRTFKYSHAKCATSIKILQNKKKVEFESEKSSVYSENNVNLDYIYIYISIFISKMQLFIINGLKSKKGRI